MSQSNPRGAQPVKDLPFDPDSPPEVLQRLVGYGLTHRDKGTPPRLLSDVVLEIFSPVQSLSATVSGCRETYRSLEAALGALGFPEKLQRDNPGHSIALKARASYGRLKGNLPYFTPSGTWPGDDRTDTSQTAHTSLLVADLDHMQRRELDPAGIRDRAGELSYVRVAFISPGGDGVKVVGEVTPPLSPGERTLHVRAWQAFVEALVRDLDIPIDVSDPQNRNLLRLCYLSDDPGIRVKTGPALTLESPPPADSKRKRTSARSRTVQESDDQKFLPTPEEWQAACPDLQRVGKGLVGPCPACSGTDRFHVDIAPPHGWGCRHCKINGNSLAPYRAAFHSAVDAWQWDPSPAAAAIRLLRRHSRGILCVRHQETDKNVAWRFLTTNEGSSGIWNADQGVLKDLLVDSVVSWSREAAVAWGQDELSRERYRAIQHFIPSVKRTGVQQDIFRQLDFAVAHLQGKGTTPDGLLVVSSDALDPSGYLGTPKGVVKLENGKLLDFETGRRSLITRTIPDVYDPSAPLTPEVERLLEDIDEDVRECWWDGWAFGLWRNPSRRYYVCLSSETGSGKSTALATFNGALGRGRGQYGGEFSPDTFAVTRAVIKSGHHAGKMGIFGPAHAIGKELSGQLRMDTGDLNSASSGIDWESPRDVGEKSAYTGAATATMWFSANYSRFRGGMFRLHDKTVADRICLMKWSETKHANDRTFLERLQTQAARQGIVAELVRRAVVLASRDMPGVPPEKPFSHHTIMHAFADSSLGEVGVWIRDHLAPARFYDKLPINQVWRQMLSDLGEMPDATEVEQVTRSEFPTVVSEIHPIGMIRRLRYERAMTRCWIGWKLVEPEEDVMPEPPKSMLECIRCGRTSPDQDSMQHVCQHCTSDVIKTLNQTVYAISKRKSFNDN